MGREDDMPERCGDPTCGGAIDERTGDCCLCGVDHVAPCHECEGHGFHARGCSEGEPDPMDLVEEW